MSHMFGNHHQHLCLPSFSFGEERGFLERRRIWETPDSVRPPERGTPDEINTYFDQRRIEDGEKVLGPNHAGRRQILKEDEARRDRNPFVNSAEKKKVYEDVLKEKRNSLVSRESRITSEWNVKKTQLEGGIAAAGTAVVPPTSLFSDRTNFYPTGANTLNLSRISTKLGLIDSEISRINGSTAPTNNDITFLGLLYQYRGVCQMAMRFEEFSSTKKLFDTDKTKIPSYIGEKSTEITQLNHDKSVISYTASDINTVKGSISVIEARIVQLQESLSKLTARASDPTAPLPPPILPIPPSLSGLVPPLPASPTPTEITAAINTIKDTLIKDAEKALDQHKEYLALVQLQVFLKETLLQIQIDRATKEKEILEYIKDLPATLTQTHIDKFVRYTTEINALNKKLKNAKISICLPDEGSIQRETLDRILDQEEDLLEDAQDALGLQLMAKGVDPVLIYNRGNFNNEGEFRNGFFNLINPLRKSTREVLKEVQEKTKEILRRNGVTPVVQDFFLDLVVVKGDISPADLELTLKDAGVRGVITTIITENITSIANNPKTTLPTILALPTLPTSTNPAITRVLNSIQSNALDYIREKRHTLERIRLGRLENGVTDYEETSFEKEYGFRIRSARDNYVRAKPKFEALGFLHTVWFDASGKFAYSGDATKIKVLLNQTIPDFRPNSGFANVNEFIEALFNPSSAKHENAKVCMTALRDDITKWEQQEDGRINAQKKGEDYLKDNQRNIVERGQDAFIDMATSGDPAQMAAIGILIFALIKGSKNKHFGLAIKGLAVGWAGYTFADKGLEIDILDKLGLTSALSPISGSASKAWEETLRRRGGVTDFEKDALAAEGMKTRALIALEDVPLEELLNWHKKVSDAKTADTDVKEVLEKETPPKLKESLGRIARSGEKFKATTVAFGLLSLSLRESAVREGYEMTDEHAPDIARMIVRAKYMHIQEDGYKSIATDAEAVVLENVYSSYLEQENHGKDFSFGMFVEKEIGPSEIELSKTLDDTWVQKAYTVMGETGGKIMERMGDAWGEGKESVYKTIVKIKEVWGPEALTWIEDMAQDGWQLGKSLGEEINLVWQGTKVVIKEYAKGAWGIVVDGFVIPFDILIGAGKTGIDFFKSGDAKRMLKEIVAQAQNLKDTAWDGLSLFPSTAPNLGGFFAPANASEVYNNQTLGHFGSEFISPALTGNPLFIAGLPDGQGGPALFAVGSVPFPDPTAPGGIQKIVEARKKAVEAAQQSITSNPMAGLTNQTINIHDHVVSMIVTGAPPNQQLHAFVRIPQGVNAERSTDVKKYEWTFEKYKEQFYKYRPQVNINMFAGTTPVLIAGTRTATIEEIINTVSSTAPPIAVGAPGVFPPPAFASRINNTTTGFNAAQEVLKNLSGTPSAIIPLLQNPENIFYNLWGHFNNRFATFFTF